VRFPFPLWTCSSRKRSAPLSAYCLRKGLTNVRTPGTRHERPWLGYGSTAANDAVEQKDGVSLGWTRGGGCAQGFSTRYYSE
jgi:hypothetical protein